MSLPVVSVVIPVYNRPLTATKALRSALAQAGVSLEVVLVDDASDPIFALPDDLAADPRVNLVRHDINAGAAAARNTGVAAARGEWIAFLDSDDEFMQGKLASQLAIADGEAPLTVIASAFRYSRERGSDDMLPIESAALADFCAGCWHCPGSTALISRRAFAQIGPLDTSLRRLEDLDWFIRLARAGGALKVAPHLGARINVGANATVANVDEAANLIALKFGLDDPRPNMPASARRNLAAYLALERAAARFKSGRRIAGGIWMLRSLWYRPRLTLHLKKWWSSFPSGDPERSGAPDAHGA
ncbi:glycosyltransferase family 2 protein [Bosea sp. NPDC003192]|jgi:glycosyltransferase involved in cell wall biosynthesis|uniref:glycosyltransferase family 2 protein n=1 Tax=Bosea sp. NPDC003192 TaxID=3390551 RepID=UPI003D030D71